MGLIKGARHKAQGTGEIFFNPAPKALLLVPYVGWDKVAVLKGN